MPERRLTILQINDLHGCLEPHPEASSGPAESAVLSDTIKRNKEKPSTGPQIQRSPKCGPEANLERTYLADPYCQMGGYVKRCRGLNLYFKMENPKGHRIEELLVEGRPVRPDRMYRAAMLGEQGVPAKYGGHRQQFQVNATESLQCLLARGGALRVGRRGSVVAV